MKMVCGPLIRYGCSNRQKHTTSEQASTAKGMGKINASRLFLKVSLFVHALLDLSVRNGCCKVPLCSLDAAQSNAMPPALWQCWHL